MKRLAPMAAALAIASLVAAACNRSSERSPAQTGTAGGAPAAAAESTRQNLDITFKSEPDPPKMGENTFEVMVMSGNSQAVTDAEVSVEFYMAAMPMMNMPEMRNTVPLKHEGSGRYRGMGNVATAGKWDATVKVMRSGQDLGTRKFSITAKQ